MRWQPRADRSLRARFISWIGHTRPLRSTADFYALLHEVTRLAGTFRALTRDELTAHSQALRVRARSGDHALAESLALAREACDRALGMRPFDVQVLGALAMCSGGVAEMATGEGKTLTAVLTAYAVTLDGSRLHILTANDYLARRDAAWMRPAYELLGLQVGCVQEGMDRDARKDAYAADVTYATANEVGFDYLRDHLVTRAEHVVQPDLQAVLVDEIDSILIDEARIPLVVAGSTASCDTDAAIALQAHDLVDSLEQDRDFEVDHDTKAVIIKGQGVSRLERAAGLDLYAPANATLAVSCNLALHARVLLRRDVDYIVRNGHIELVDDFKGRVAQRRRWPDGIQTAVEVKEGIHLSGETKIIGSTTIQCFIRNYRTVCGMTGTAATSADELYELYGLRTTVVPPHTPCIRTDHPDVVFTHQAAKHAAIVREIADAHMVGRPVLVGTSSVAESEQLAQSLRKARIPCDVLNARNDELEARIIARAGICGAVTISTNMAGRGTDIVLGHGAADVGGLYVLGTNRHEARRVDLQLRGRAGRQGDPGASRFFVSLDDDLVEAYGVDGLVRDTGIDLAPRDEAIDDGEARRRIEDAQATIEWVNARTRATIDRYDRVLEDARRSFYAARGDVLRGRSQVLTNHPRWTELEATFGRDALIAAERDLLLHHLDEEWSRLLEHLRELRDEVMLKTLGRGDPLRAFSDECRRATAELLENANARTRETFSNVPINETGADLHAAGLTRPTATWTYLLSEPPMRFLRHSPFGPGNDLSVNAAVIANLVREDPTRRV